MIQVPVDLPIYNILKNSEVKEFPTFYLVHD